MYHTIVFDEHVPCTNIIVVEPGGFERGTLIENRQ
jgi:hypothetical protein